MLPIANYALKVSNKKAFCVIAPPPPNPSLKSYISIHERSPPHTHTPPAPPYTHAQMFPCRIERKSSSFTHVIDMSHCERVNKMQRLELWLRSGLNAGGQQRAKLEAAGVLLTKDHLSEKQRHESTSHSVLTFSHTKNNKKIHIQLRPPLTFSVLYVFTYLLKYTSGQDILQLCISK